MEEVTANEAKASVDRVEGAFGIGPSVVGVIRDGRMGMVKISDGNCENQPDLD